MIPRREQVGLVRELAAKPNGVLVTCIGGSMAPTVRRGGRIRVRACREVQAGDVVLFTTADGETMILHRVVFKLPLLPWFLHLGDAESSDSLGVAQTWQVVARADLPQELHSLPVYYAAVKRTLQAAKRMVGRGLPR